MSEESVSDFAYGIALGATAVAVVFSLLAVGFLFWAGDDPLSAVWLLPPLAIAVFLVVRLRRRREKNATDDEK